MPPSPSSPSTAAAAKHYEQSRRRAYQSVLSGAWQQAESALAGLAHDRRFGLKDWTTLATARYRLGQFEEMAQAARRALELEPDDFKAAHLLTMALIQQHRFAEALPYFQRHASGPAREHYHFVTNHGITLAQLGRPAEAVQAYLEAVVLQPADPAIHMRLGLAFKSLKMYEQSAESFLTAHVLDPKRFAAQLMVLHMRQYACVWDGFEAARQDIVKSLTEMDVRAGGTQGEGAVWSLTAIETPPALFRKATEQVAVKCAAGVVPLPRRRVPAEGEARRIRVAYVSSDFHSHATTLLMVEALERRDTERFEVTLYSHGKDDGSVVLRRVRGACEHFVDMTGMSEEQMARRIHADGIDILVDLKGHTYGNRMRLFAYRPAPVQVAFLGFPGTCGADYIDYIVGDRVVTPLEHADWYSEKIAQLPHSYQPNDGRRPRPAADSRARWGLAEDALVLGNFNQSFKLSPDTFDAWVRILKAVPNSVLWLLADNPQATRNLQREAEARGLDPARLVFAPRAGVEAHLARLPVADLMLDNWPCNAHTTASDALWMGVPLVTLMGDSFASRVAASLLHAVGLGELVCTSVEHYEALVIELLNDRPRLQALRQRLDAGRASFPLFDGGRFAADLEQLYLRMIDLERRGLPPQALPAAG
ncbi:tetratricopeptide repeat protein [Aquabacterium sp. A7-Y]|uniref:O-linked N-acetylglucosamine transferase, SPINDLY family protein n=1 Tax=Aquabacterium sp. A7-Y TaxID=1349605 RepID=UPI00223DCB81|nr:tetratricopeptide repeat protein [Aquabacterium sp. A7-Y]MCW7540536.1 tetratricopeptide repeat protein [Aquabacterium sp. A7-Y]